MKNTPKVRTVVALIAVLANACSDSTTPVTAAARIVFLNESAVIGLHGQATLAPIVLDRNDDPIIGANGIGWTSGNDAIATVDEAGVVRGIALGGPVTITATLGDVSGTVTASVVAGQVIITPSIQSLVVGTSVQMSAQVFDALGDPIPDATTSWSASGSGVVSLDPQTLVLSALASGDASVSVHAAGRTSTLPLIVGVPSEYDGTYASASTATHQVQLDVVFARIVRFSGVVRPTMTCTISVSATPLTAINANATFQFGLTGLGTVNGSFTPGAGVNGTINGLSNGGNTTCGFGPLATGVPSAAFAAFR